MVSAPALPFSTLLPLLPISLLANSLPLPLIAAAPDRVRFSWFAPRVLLTLEMRVSMPPVALDSITRSPALSR